VFREYILLQLLKLINPLTLSDVGDRWGLVPEKEGVFTVKSVFFTVSDLVAPTELVPPWLASVFTVI
jgi:hypothetical protein